jgi:hypothetical protein
LLYLLNQLNGGLKIQAKVNEDPINALSLIFFLFKYKHVVVEELLQSLVRIVNAQLFESIELIWPSRGLKGFGPVNPRHENVFVHLYRDG